MAKREPSNPGNRRPPEDVRRRRKSQLASGRRQEDGERRRAGTVTDAKSEAKRRHSTHAEYKAAKTQEKEICRKEDRIGDFDRTLILVLAAIGVLASKMSKLETEELNPDKLSISDELTYDETGYLNVALFGLDTRENDEEMGTRSDTIIIASLNRETKEIRMASIYRDTLLQQDDGTYNKANVAYSFGEEEEAVAMLNRNFDLNIQHYVTVDFSAMVDVIDALGGIPITVQEEEIPYINGYACEIIENTGVDTWAVTEPGLQNLTGVQATAYARIRASGDDYQRTERRGKY